MPSPLDPAMRATHELHEFPAVYMSCMSQNFRLMHVSNLSARNFIIFLLMYRGSLSLWRRPPLTARLGRYRLWLWAGGWRLVLAGTADCAAVVLVLLLPVLTIVAVAAVGGTAASCVNVTAAVTAAPATAAAVIGATVTIATAVIGSSASITTSAAVATAAVATTCPRTSVIAVHSIDRTNGNILWTPTPTRYTREKKTVCPRNSALERRQLFAENAGGYCHCRRLAADASEALAALNARLVTQEDCER